ncbi:hypothetical protein J2W76_000518 [Methylorubrum zatmanii]|jgi:hypothetical protein|nr:hypothetical protein [Methylorubrum zatmanii]MCP1556111.1 hypothetical protein [Methylorubrum extorquens]MCP1577576.1 hypothetical protein [Methylorubrum extorquens]
MPRCVGKSAGQECRARGIVPRIVPKGIQSSERLGRHRWVAARNHACFNEFRRLPVRDEPRTDIYQAFTGLAASLITLAQIRRFCQALFAAFRAACRNPVAGNHGGIVRATGGNAPIRTSGLAGSGCRE